jgi:hypothetical protein
MYRDTASTLDEHDRAVGAILIGEALVDTCEHAQAVERSPRLHDGWRAFAEANDAYPEIWRHLDRARRVLAQRGLNTAGYDELRPHAPKSLTRGEKIDHAALDEAKRALGELKLALPGADWDAIEARTAGLVSAPISRKQQQRIIFGAVAIAMVLAVFTWLSAIVPEHKPSQRETMRDELAEVAQQRKVKIDGLRLTLGNRCEPTEAHELVKLLVLDGRGPDAKAFGEDYVVRCGDDEVVEHWAHAPRPGH